MIDFRYHLVSLISVFLALAVGIVLGAGPLKEAIGDTLTGEVEALRSRAADLRAEADTVSAELARTNAAFDEAGDDLLADLLGARNVAIVEIGGVHPTVLTRVGERIEQAGGEITATVHVEEAWIDPARRAFRQSIAGTLADYLDPEPAVGSGVEVELAEALAQGLTTPVPEEPEELAESAGAVLDVLVEGGLIRVPQPVTAPADAVVMLVGPGTEPVEPSDEADVDTEASERVEAWLAAGVELAVATQVRSSGLVVAGVDARDGGLLANLRTNVRTVTRVSTVSAVDTVAGELSVPTALASRIAGTVGQFGPEPDATAAFPSRTVLAPIVRVPVDPVDETDDAETDDDADGSDEEATG